ncbi:EpsG family protein [Levilactobacillus brevis]|uniref:EpsG family protein n=1 Tax=Levilactobacillus brevis TaxID=1580 RepID=UPI0032E52F4C
MTFIVLTIVGGLSSFSGLLKKFWGIGMLLFLGFLMGEGISGITPDYILYMTDYENGTNYFESGYNLLSSIGRSMGMNYSTFRLSISLLSVLILLWAILRLTTNITVVVFLYAISIFSIDAIQVRNFVMLCLVVLAFSFLRKRGFKNYSLAAIILLVASSIHTLGFMFFIPYALSFIKLNKQIDLSKMILLFSVVLVFLGYFFKSFLMKLSESMLSIFNFRSTTVNNVGTVYDNGAGLRYIAVALIISIIQFLVVMYISRSIENERFANVTRFILPVAFLGLFAVIMMTVSLDYCRLLRNTTLFIYVYVAIYFGNQYELKRNNNKQFLSLLFSVILLAALTFFLQDFMLYPNAGEVYGYTIQYIR